MESQKTCAIKIQVRSATKDNHKTWSPQVVGRAQPTRVKRGKLFDRNQFAEWHSSWNRHSTRSVTPTSSTRNPEILKSQSIVHQWTSDHCLSSTPVRWILNPRSQDEHKYTQATSTTVGTNRHVPWDWAQGLSDKSKHGTCHRQGLNLWLGKANEATASQH